MRKGVLVLVLLALALVVAGCQGGGKGPASSSSTPFIGGSEGLKVTFVENAPPIEILDNPKPLTATGQVDKTEVMKFDIILKLENVGEQDIVADNAKVTIGGIFPADFGVTGSKTTSLTEKTPPSLQNILFPKKLDGVKKDPEGDKIPGGIEEMQFNELGYMKQLEGNTEFPIQADVCYKYTTKAVGDFCMRADLTRTQGGVCQAKGTKPVFSSGSPVQVTSVDESIGGRSKVILKFKIKTLGSGSFFKPDAEGAPNCVRGDFSKENFVKVTVNSGVDGLACSGFSGTPPTGDVRLTNGEGIVTCIQDGVSVDAVQKATVTIEYNHLISASTKLLVKHLPGFEGTPASSSSSGASASSGTECSTGTIDVTCKTAAGATGTRVCKTDKTWSTCVSPGSTP